MRGRAVQSCVTTSSTLFIISSSFAKRTNRTPYTTMYDSYAPTLRRVWEKEQRTLLKRKIQKKRFPMRAACTVDERDCIVPDQVARVVAKLGFVCGPVNVPIISCECDDVIRRAHVSNSNRTGRSLMDCSLSPPPPPTLLRRTEHPISVLEQILCLEGWCDRVVRLAVVYYMRVMVGVCIDDARCRRKPAFPPNERGIARTRGGVTFGRP